MVCLVNLLLPLVISAVAANAADAADITMESAYNFLTVTEVLKAIREGDRNDDVIKSIKRSPERMVSFVDDDPLGGKSLLMYSSAYNRIEIARFLIGCGANVNQRSDFYGSPMNTPLIYAASWGHLEMVKILLGAGALIDVQGSMASSALMFAAVNGHWKVVKELIDAGANADLQDTKGQTALALASWYGHEEVVKLLVEAGADLNLQRHMRYSGSTPLMKAQGMKEHGIVTTLTQAGANLDIQDAFGYTVSHYMAKRQDEEGLGIVLPYCPNLTIREYEMNATAMELALANGYVATADLLKGHWNSSCVLQRQRRLAELSGMSNVAETLEMYTHNTGLVDVKSMDSGRVNVSSCDIRRTKRGNRIMESVSTGYETDESGSDDSKTVDGTDAESGFIEVATGSPEIIGFDGHVTAQEISSVYSRRHDADEEKGTETDGHELESVDTISENVQDRPSPLEFVSEDSGCNKPKTDDLSSTKMNQDDNKLKMGTLETPQLELGKSPSFESNAENQALQMSESDAPHSFESDAVQQDSAISGSAKSGLVDETLSKSESDVPLTVMLEADDQDLIEYHKSDSSDFKGSDDVVFAKSELSNLDSSMLKDNADEYLVESDFGKLEPSALKTYEENLEKSQSDDLASFESIHAGEEDSSKPDLYETQVYEIASILELKEQNAKELNSVGSLTKSEDIPRSVTYASHSSSVDFIHSEMCEHAATYMSCSSDYTSDLETLESNMQSKAESYEIISPEFNTKEVSPVKLELDEAEFKAVDENLDKSQFDFVSSSEDKYPDERDLTVSGIDGTQIYDTRTHVEIQESDISESKFPKALQEHEELTKSEMIEPDEIQSTESDTGVVTPVDSESDEAELKVSDEDSFESNLNSVSSSEDKVPDEKDLTEPDIDNIKVYNTRTYFGIQESDISESKSSVLLSQSEVLTKSELGDPDEIQSIESNTNEVNPIKSESVEVELVAAYEDSDKSQFDSIISSEDKIYNKKDLPKSVTDHIQFHDMGTYVEIQELETSDSKSLETVLHSQHLTKSEYSEPDEIQSTASNTSEISPIKSELNEEELKAVDESAKSQFDSISSSEDKAPDENDLDKPDIDNILVYSTRTHAEIQESSEIDKSEFPESVDEHEDKTRSEIIELDEIQLTESNTIETIPVESESDKTELKATDVGLAKLQFDSVSSPKDKMLFPDEKVLTKSDTDDVQVYGTKTPVEIQELEISRSKSPKAVDENEDLIKTEINEADEIESSDSNISKISLVKFELDDVELKITDEDSSKSHIHSASSSEDEISDKKNLPELDIDDTQAYDKRAYIGIKESEASESKSPVSLIQNEVLTKFELRIPDEIWSIESNTTEDKAELKATDDNSSKSQSDSIISSEDKVPYKKDLTESDIDAMQVYGMKTQFVIQDSETSESMSSRSVFQDEDLRKSELGEPKEIQYIESNTNEVSPVKSGSEETELKFTDEDSANLQIDSVSSSENKVLDKKDLIESDVDDMQDHRSHAEVREPEIILLKSPGYVNEKEELRNSEFSEPDEIQSTKSNGSEITSVKSESDEVELKATYENSPKPHLDSISSFKDKVTDEKKLTEADIVDLQVYNTRTHVMIQDSVISESKSTESINEIEDLTKLEISKPIEMKSMESDIKEVFPMKSESDDADLNVADEDSTELHIHYVRSYEDEVPDKNDLTESDVNDIHIHDIKTQVKTQESEISESKSIGSVNEHEDLTRSEMIEPDEIQSTGSSVNKVNPVRFESDEGESEINDEDTTKLPFDSFSYSEEQFPQEKTFIASDIDDIKVYDTRPHAEIQESETSESKSLVSFIQNEDLTKAELSDPDMIQFTESNTTAVLQINSESDEAELKVTDEDSTELQLEPVSSSEDKLPDDKDLIVSNTDIIHVYDMRTDVEIQESEVSELKSPGSVGTNGNLRKSESNLSETAEIQSTELNTNEIGSAKSEVDEMKLKFAEKEDLPKSDIDSIKFHEVTVSKEEHLIKSDTDMHIYDMKTHAESQIKESEISESKSSWSIIENDLTKSEHSDLPSSEMDTTDSDLLEPSRTHNLDLIDVSSDFATSEIDVLYTIVSDLAPQTGLSELHFQETTTIKDESQKPKTDAAMISEPKASGGENLAYSKSSDLGSDMKFSNATNFMKSNFEDSQVHITKPDMKLEETDFHPIRSVTEIQNFIELESSGESSAKSDSVESDELESSGHHNLDTNEDSSHPEISEPRDMFVDDSDIIGIKSQSYPDEVQSSVNIQVEPDEMQSSVNILSEPDEVQSSVNIQSKLDEVQSSANKLGLIESDSAKADSFELDTVTRSIIKSSFEQNKFNLNVDGDMVKIASQEPLTFQSDMYYSVLSKVETSEQYSGNPKVQSSDIIGTVLTEQLVKLESIDLQSTDLESNTKFKEMELIDFSPTIVFDSDSIDGKSDELNLSTMEKYQAISAGENQREFADDELTSQGTESDTPYLANSENLVSHLVRLENDWTNVAKYENDIADSANLDSFEPSLREFKNNGYNLTGIEVSESDFAKPEASDLHTNETKSVDLESDIIGNHTNVGKSSMHDLDQDISKYVVSSSEDKKSNTAISEPLNTEIGEKGSVNVDVDTDQLESSHLPADFIKSDTVDVTEINYYKNNKKDDIQIEQHILVFNSIDDLTLHFAPKNLAEPERAKSEQEELEAEGPVSEGKKIYDSTLKPKVPVIDSVKSKVEESANPKLKTDILSTIELTNNELTYTTSKSSDFEFTESTNIKTFSNDVKRDDLDFIGLKLSDLSSDVPGNVKSNFEASSARASLTESESAVHLSDASTVAMLPSRNTENLESLKSEPFELIWLKSENLNLDSPKTSYNGNRKIPSTSDDTDVIKLDVFGMADNKLYSTHDQSSHVYSMSPVSRDTEVYKVERTNLELDPAVVESDESKLAGFEIATSNQFEVKSILPSFQNLEDVNVYDIQSETPEGGLIATEQDTILNVAMHTIDCQNDVTDQERNGVTATSLEKEDILSNYDDVDIAFETPKSTEICENDCDELIHLDEFPNVMKDSIEGDHAVSIGNGALDVPLDIAPKDSSQEIFISSIIVASSINDASTETSVPDTDILKAELHAGNLETVDASDKNSIFSAKDTSAEITVMEKDISVLTKVEKNSVDANAMYTNINEPPSLAVYTNTADTHGDISIYDRKYPSQEKFHELTDGMELVVPVIADDGHTGPVLDDNVSSAESTVAIAAADFNQNSELAFASKNTTFVSDSLNTNKLMIKGDAEKNLAREPANEAISSKVVLTNDHMLKSSENNSNIDHVESDQRQILALDVKDTDFHSDVEKADIKGKDHKNDIKDSQNVDKESHYVEGKDNEFLLTPDANDNAIDTEVIDIMKQESIITSMDVDKNFALVQNSNTIEPEFGIIDKDVNSAGTDRIVTSGAENDKYSFGNNVASVADELTGYSTELEADTVLVKSTDDKDVDLDIIDNKDTDSEAILQNYDLVNMDFQDRDANTVDVECISINSVALSETTVFKDGIDIDDSSAAGNQVDISDVLDAIDERDDITEFENARTSVEDVADIPMLRLSYNDAPYSTEGDDVDTVDIGIDIGPTGESFDLYIAKIGTDEIITTDVHSDSDGLAEANLVDLEDIEVETVFANALDLDVIEGDRVGVTRIEVGNNDDTIIDIGALYADVVETESIRSGTPDTDSRGSRTPDPSRKESRLTDSWKSEGRFSGSFRSEGRFTDSPIFRMYAFNVLHSPRVIEGEKVNVKSSEIGTNDYAEVAGTEGKESEAVVIDSIIGGDLIRGEKGFTDSGRIKSGLTDSGRTKREFTDSGWTESRFTSSSRSEGKLTDSPVFSKYYAGALNSPRNFVSKYVFDLQDASSADVVTASEADVLSDNEESVGIDVTNEAMVDLETITAEAMNSDTSAGGLVKSHVYNAAAIISDKSPCEGVGSDLPSLINEDVKVTENEEIVISYMCSDSSSDIKGADETVTDVNTVWRNIKKNQAKTADSAEIEMDDVIIINEMSHANVLDSLEAEGAVAADSVSTGVVLDVNEIDDVISGEIAETSLENKSTEFVVTSVTGASSSERDDVNVIDVDNTIAIAYMTERGHKEAVQENTDVRFSAEKGRDYTDSLESGFDTVAYANIAETVANANDLVRVPFSETPEWDNQILESTHYTDNDSIDTIDVAAVTSDTVIETENRDPPNESSVEVENKIDVIGKSPMNHSDSSDIKTKTITDLNKMEMVFDENMPPTMPSTEVEDKVVMDKVIESSHTAAMMSITKAIVTSNPSNDSEMMITELEHDVNKDEFPEIDITAYSMSLSKSTISVISIGNAQTVPVEKVNSGISSEISMTRTVPPYEGISHASTDNIPTIDVDAKQVSALPTRHNVAIQEFDGMEMFEIDSSAEMTEAFDVNLVSVVGNIDLSNAGDQDADTAVDIAEIIVSSNKRSSKDNKNYRLEPTTTGTPELPHSALTEETSEVLASVSQIIAEQLATAVSQVGVAENLISIATDQLTEALETASQSDAEHTSTAGHSLP